MMDQWTERPESTADEFPLRVVSFFATLFFAGLVWIAAVFLPSLEGLAENPPEKPPTAQAVWDAGMPVLAVLCGIAAFLTLVYTILPDRNTRRLAYWSSVGTFGAIAVFAFVLSVV